MVLAIRLVLYAVFLGAGGAALGAGTNWRKAAAWGAVAMTALAVEIGVAYYQKRHSQ